ncbi:MAG: serine/threonine-protein kinase [Nitriliruptorales bacterium]|nr:serine/threonine-protein kinase [Nitriliruptorales bacterium]
MGALDTTEHRWSPTAGEIVNDRWQLDRRVTAGTSVETWHGRDLQLQRDVALQVIREEDLDDEDAQEAFKRRVSLLASVEHANVIRVFDVVNIGDVRLGVWEWVDGIVLEQALRNRLWGATAAACFGSQLAAGLSALHVASLVHRNVSPTNLMIASDGIVKLGGGGRIRNIVSSSTLTDQDLLVRETAYLAPEQVNGSSRDARIDVFAAGVVMWELVTGRRAIDLVDEAGPPELPRPSDETRGIPDVLDDTIYAATRLEPAGRPADGTELYELLREAVPPRPAAVLARSLRDLDLAGGS